MSIITMKNRFARRVLLLLIVLVFMTVLTAVVAHGHSSVKSGDESHCPLCMAATSTTHALASSVASLNFTPAQDVLPEHIQSFTLGHFPSIVIQDRAPPSI
jgi:hypothetical protein